ncbi:MAG: octopine/nopaline dehydrogenase [candidate division NC10 bacterium]|jgi:opine dehydrogenase|nr:octopine/nopaline dehydrogenase [candidate division NC10 bacterium]
MSPLRFAVIGAGNGGQSMAAHLTLLGFPVQLWDIEPEKVQALRQRGSIALSGAVEGEARVPLVTGDMAEAVEGAAVIMVILPTVYHGSVAKSMAPHLRSGQVVVLNPGATGGALEVRATLRENGCRAQVTVAETDTLLYACRSPKPGEAIIHEIKRHVDVAALPASESPGVAATLNTAFPQFAPASSVLQTSLTNMNAMMHPAPTLLNAGRIESRATFEYYGEGVTPSIARVVESIDGERMAVAAALGVRVPSLMEWYAASYGTDGHTLYESVQQVRGYDGIKGPTTLQTRYLFEDIPTGLVPLCALGEVLGVPTPLMRAVVDLGSTLLGRDFWREGRSLAKLGLAGAGPEEIRRMTLE